MTMFIIDVFIRMVASDTYSVPVREKAGKSEAGSHHVAPIELHKDVKRVARADI